MKIIVISDTHGRRGKIDKVLALHPRYDMLLFLGDGLRDFLGVEQCGFASVRGNCDGLAYVGGATVPAERMLDADGVRILMMHGHERGVKSGTERALLYAHERGADILLYGHTHVPEQKYCPEGTQVGDAVLTRPMYVFNPGSLGNPPDGVASFGVIEIRHGQVLLSHGKL